MSVVVKNLKKTYVQGETRIEALKNINLTIQKSEIVALLGTSGSGKSTLLGLLAGLDKPNDGEILIDNVNIYNLKEEELTKFRASHISLVFQQFHLIPHLTALENVHLPLQILKKPDIKKANSLLKAVGLDSRISHLPQQLSGGECQRVAIARALIIDPTLLLADEPSGNLDNETAQSVMDLFFKTLRDNKTTCLLVTHNEELAKKCDRVLKIHRGLI